MIGATGVNIVQSQIPTHVPLELVTDSIWYGQEDAAGDPNAGLTAFHQGPRVVYIPANNRNPFGTWVLTRFEDIRKAFFDTEHYTSAHIAGFNVLAGMDAYLIPVELDPPDHGKYRHLLTPFFAAPAVRALEPVMRRGVNDVIDEILPGGGCDVVPYGFKMMAAVWCELMGAPLEKSDVYIRFLSQMIHQYDPEIRFQCARDMLEAMKELYRDSKGRGGKGLIPQFVNSKIDGVEPSEAECAGLILFMFLAGMDTMGATTSWILRHLAIDSARRRELIGDPGKIRPFVEEIFRRYAIVSTNRFVKKDIEIGGVTLKAGDNVLLSTPLACMDPAKFERAAEIRPERTERHIAFGGGAHFCLGAGVARAQIPIMIEEWLRRIPEFRIAEGAKITAHIGDVIALDSLPLVWRTSA
jgi:cytochrome P450